MKINRQLFELSSSQTDGQTKAVVPREKRRRAVYMRVVTDCSRVRASAADGKQSDVCDGQR